MAILSAHVRYPVVTVVSTRRLALRDVAFGGPAKPWLLEHHYDIRAEQELLDHHDVSTTEIFAHVNRGPAGLRSRADRNARRVDRHPWPPTGRPPAVLPRAPAPCSTVREEEATDSQPRVTAGAAGRRRASGPGVLDCAARSVARTTQLWRIRSSADS